MKLNNSYYFDSLNKLESNNILNELSIGLKAFECPLLFIASDSKEESIELKNDLKKLVIEKGFKLYDFNVTSIPSMYVLSKSYNSVSVYFCSNETKNGFGFYIIKNGLELSEIDIRNFNKEIDKQTSSFKPIKDSFVSIYEYTKILKGFKFNTNLRFVFDASYGSLIYLFKDVFNYYNLNVDVINDKAFVKYDSDSLVYKNPQLVDKYLENNPPFDFYFAFNNTGDDFIIINRNKEVINNESLLLFIARFYKYKNPRKNTSAVLTDEVNPGIRKILESLRYNIIQIKESDSISDACKSNGSVFGYNKRKDIIIPEASISRDAFVFSLFLIQIYSTTFTRNLENESNLELVPSKNVVFKKFDEVLCSTNEFKNEIELIKDKYKNSNIALSINIDKKKKTMKISCATTDNKVFKSVVNDIKTLVNGEE